MSVANEYSVPTFLDDHFSQIYENVLSLGNPLVSTPDFLQRTRRTSFLRYISNILSLSYREREKLLDPLIEYVLSLDVSNPEAMEKVITDVRKKLEDNPQYGQYFTKLERVFESLNPQDQRYVFKLSIIRIRTKVDSIRLMINDQIIKEKDPLELVLLDQVFYSIQGLSDILLSKLDKHRKLELNEIGSILVSTLKLEAVRREKISMEDMEDDIALGSILLPPKHVLITEEVAKPVLDLLGE